jgi:ATP phosphoribosyltransferase
MLRIAVPNKGSLADSSIAILKEAGYRQRTDSRDLVLSDPDNSVEFYYLRPRDIAIYVGSGELEAGITGRDLLIDSGAHAEEILALDFGDQPSDSQLLRVPTGNLQIL